MQDWQEDLKIHPVLFKASYKRPAISCKVSNPRRADHLVNTVHGPRCHLTNCAIVSSESRLSVALYLVIGIFTLLHQCSHSSLSDKVLIVGVVVTTRHLLDQSVGRETAAATAD